MDIIELETFLNKKLEIQMGRSVNVKMFIGYTSTLWPVLKLYYKGNIILEMEIGGYGPKDLQNIEYTMVRYSDCPLSLAVIEKIKEYDKNSWYVFLAP